MVFGDLQTERSRLVEPEIENRAKRMRRDSFYELMFKEVDTVATPSGVNVEVPVVKGDLYSLPIKVQRFIAENVALCKPNGIYICDGSDAEGEEIKEKMVARGMLTKLDKYDNCYTEGHQRATAVYAEKVVGGGPAAGAGQLLKRPLHQLRPPQQRRVVEMSSYLVRTDPADVARVESKTFICTEKKYATVPHVKDGVKGILGQWISPEALDKELNDRFPGCMKGRVMYVIPYSMGPIGSPLSKIGVQLTDFNYVVLSMRIMARVSSKIWNILGDEDFVQCVHSIGAPRPVERKIVNHWPCNPEKTLIAHFPEQRKIMSYGSGYGGNSLLGKKCFALRIASCIARDEGWLAEHMLIMGVTNPAGEEKFIAAAFPSACGKTNMAMMKPSLPGWKVRCLGDDIAWMRFDQDGRLRAINPEAGFFGVAPGTNHKTNPMAMDTIGRNTIFTNVGLTEDDGFFWEGMEKEIDPDTNITTWKGEPWKIGQEGKAAHPNSRFCSPAAGCPIIDDRWEDPEGVPIDAIVFGGRRPEGVPLVMEAFDWTHGVTVGATLKSEATAACEDRGKIIMHDPMAMRPFMGYNFGEYLQHWLNLEQPGRHMPKVFHVNWFRLNEQGKFLWPGFGENIRVIDWMFKRCNGEDVAEPSPIGYLPKSGALNTEGLGEVDMEELFSLPRSYWTEEIRETRQFLDEQVGIDLPSAVHREVLAQFDRIRQM